MLAGAALIAAALAPLSADAQETAEKAGGSTLRICASKVEPPYSTAKGDGFENKIATEVAEAMGRKAEFVWFDRPAIYLVRDGLDKKLCDVVLGVDATDERVLVTKPYFRTGYAYLTKADAAIGHSWEDAGKPDVVKYAFRFYSPAELIIKQLGKYEGTVSYQLSLVNFEDKRNKYTQIPADRLVSEVASGNADLGIVFASDVARYVKSSSTPLKLTMIADDFSTADGRKVPLHFDQAMGVRKDDKALAEALDAAIDKARPEIERTLAEEGVPVLKPNT